MIFQGIRNIGNTCYLNCAIQCFVHLPFELDRVKSEKSEFLKILIHFCERYFSKQNCDPRELLNYLSRYQTDFQHLALCDAQEALFYLLDLYHENTKEPWDDDIGFLFFDSFCKSSVDEWKVYSPHYSIVSLYFTTQTEEMCVCKKCNRIIQKRFPIFTNIDICDREIELINHGIKKETLDDYKCESCKVAGSCVKITTWSYLSDYLIFYNKKMNFFLKPKISIPLVTKNRMIEYELLMTINHCNDHYTTYIRDSCDPNQWMCCDDDQIKQANGPVTKTIYLYIYKIINK